MSDDIVATFPPDLPQRFSPDGLTVTPISNVIQTQMATGPSKRRKRDTINQYNVAGSLLVCSSDYDLFEQFYYVTLGGGVSKFEWIHPHMSSRICEFYFDQSQTPYTFAPVDRMGKFFTLSLTLIMKESYGYGLRNVEELEMYEDMEMI